MAKCDGSATTRPTVLTKQKSMCTTNACTFYAIIMFVSLFLFQLRCVEVLNTSFMCSPPPGFLVVNAYCMRSVSNLMMLNSIFQQMQLLKQLAYLQHRCVTVNYELVQGATTLIASGYVLTG